MNKYFKNLSLLVVSCCFVNLFAQAPPEGCLDELRELYKELQTKENQENNLLDILKIRMKKTIYRYSEAYLKKAEIPVNATVQKYLEDNIDQNTQGRLDPVLDSTFNRLRADISSLPQNTQEILDGEFNQVDKFIVMGLLSQNTCEGDALCTNKQTLEGFHGMLMNINNDPANSIEAKKILENEYDVLADRFAKVVAGRFRDYVAKEKENEQCRDFLSGIPTSMLDSVNPLLLLGCDNSNQTILAKDMRENLEEFVEYSQGSCMLPFLYFEYVECGNDTDKTDVADSSENSSPDSEDAQNVWSISIEKQGSPDKREVTVTAIVTRPTSFKIAGDGKADQNTWGSFSWKCNDEDCGENKNKTVIERENKSIKIEVSFVPSSSGEGVPERVSTGVDIDAFCENYTSLGCQDEESEDELEDESSQEVANLFDYLDTCYLNLSPGFCNQMVPPHRGVGLPPDPVSWTLGHN